MKKIITSENKGLFPHLRELIDYKDLFLTLAWKDFKIRYAQTTLGLLWTILKPVISANDLSYSMGLKIGS